MNEGVSEQKRWNVVINGSPLVPNDEFGAKTHDKRMTQNPPAKKSVAKNARTVAIIVLRAVIEQYSPIQLKADT